MSKIDVRGIIVPSMFDLDFFQDYIEKGIIMPESSFRNALKEADKTEKLSLYINSPGGSVIAGNEIINAINEWAAETGQAVEITVGSLAASMAANILVAVRAKVSAHKNAKIMFHGVTTEMWGGVEAMQDEVDLMQKMNADIQTALLGKTSLAPETVAVWFKEGREGWLGSAEALEIGLVDEVIDVMAEEVVIPEDVKSQISARGLDIAAVLFSADKIRSQAAETEEESSEETNEEDDENQDDNSSEEEESSEEQSDEESTEEESEESDSESEEESSEETNDDDNSSGEDGGGEEEEEQDAGEEDAGAPEILQLSKALESVHKGNRTLQAKNDKLRGEMAVLKETISGLQGKLEIADNEKQALSKRVSQLSLQAVKPAEEDEGNKSWAAAVKECNGDYADAKRRFPNAHKAYFEESQKDKR